jgi:WD40 repeat protein
MAADGQTALVSEYHSKRDDWDESNRADLWCGPGMAEGRRQRPRYRGHRAGRQATGRRPGRRNRHGPSHLLDAATGKLIRDVSGHLNGVTEVRFTADGKYELPASRDTCVRICQVADGKEVAVAGTPRGGQSKDWISAFALSPDERALAGADIAGLIQVWELGA